MKKCKSCQKEIDPKAKKCPYCQSDLRNNIEKHPILAGIIILFVIGMIAGAGSKKGTSTNATIVDMASETTNSTQPEAQPTLVPTAVQAPIVIDAKALVGEFDKNKLAAQEKYTGKLVQTTAVIKNISGGSFGDYYLSLDPTNEQYYFGTTLMCYFKDKNVLTSLANGQSVTVIGTMQDMSVGTVSIKDCSLVK